MQSVPSGKMLGARIEGLDLAKPLAEREVEEIIQAIGRYGVLCFPRQRLSARQHKDFAARFGELEINVASGAYQEPGIPEVMILSNIVKDGKPIGLADAGQDWHTDMSYSKTIAFANVLYALEVPRRNGKVLGATEFSSMHAAYEGLPDDLKARLDGMTVLHGAVLSHQNSILEYIISKGAKLDAKNQIGWTPYMMTKGIFLANAFKEFPEEAKILEDAMKKQGIPVQ